MIQDTETRCYTHSTKATPSTLLHAETIHILLDEGVQGDIFQKVPENEHIGVLVLLCSKNQVLSIFLRTCLGHI